MSADDKAAAAWDDYVSQQQEEKIEQLERELIGANESFRKLNIHALNLVDRIRRLEEAGDDLHDGWRGNRENKDKYLWAWLIAKEAKP